MPDVGVHDRASRFALLGSLSGPMLGALALTPVLRVLAVIGLGPYRYVDSGDYETLDLLGGARRPWVTPLLYHLAGDDDRVRVLLQGLLGAVAWSVLALELVAQLRRPAARTAGLLVVLALALTTSVTNWDNAILSESLALSSTALLAGLLLRFGRRGDGLAAAGAVATFLLWIFTRQNHLVLGWLVAGAAVGTVGCRLVRRRPVGRPLAGLVAGLVVVALLAVASYRQNTEILHFNTAMVIGARVLTDREDYGWFRDHGMPPLPKGVEIGQVSFPEPLLEDDRFGDWVRTEGVGTYVRFLLAHPWRAATEPLDHLVSGRPSYADPPAPDETMLSPAEAYSASRQVVPEPLEDLLWDPGSTGTVLTLLAGVLVLTTTRWYRAGWDRRWSIPLGIVALQFPALVVTWHASVAELGRLALTSAVALRIGLILQVAALADGWLSDRAEVQSDLAPPPGTSSELLRLP